MKFAAQTEDRVFIALALLCALAVGCIGGWVMRMVIK